MLCSRCSNPIPAEEMRPKSRRCLACRRTVAAERYAANPQRQREASARYLKGNPEARARRRESGRRYYANHTEEFLAAQKKRREDRPEHYRKLVRESAARHPETREKYRELNLDKLRERGREYAKTHRSDQKDRKNSYQNESIENATRHYHEWAGWELELVADRSRSCRELARTLHRTYFAVEMMRHCVFNDPKTIQHAGLPTQSLAG